MHSFSPMEPYNIRLFTRGRNFSHCLSLFLTINFIKHSRNNTIHTIENKQNPRQVSWKIKENLVSIVIRLVYKFLSLVLIKRDIKLHKCTIKGNRDDIVAMQTSKQYHISYTYYDLIVSFISMKN